MQSILSILKLIGVTALAFVNSLIIRFTSPRFELVLIIGLILTFYLLFFNILVIIKIIYSLINYKKLKLDSSPKNNKSVNLNLVNSVKKTKLLKKLRVSLSTSAKAIFTGTFITPFNLKKFARNIKQKKDFKFWKIHFRIPFLLIWTIKVVAINAIIIYFLFSTVKKQFATYPQYFAVFPEEEKVWNDYQRPIEIAFNIPIDENSLIINMAPETDGYWEFEKSLPYLPFTRKIKFYPNETIFPDQDIMIYLTDLTNHFHTMDGGEHLIRFYSISLPIIESTYPENQAIDIPIDRDIVLNLNQKDGGYVDWEFEFDKDVEFEAIRDNSRTVKLSFTKSLSQDESYKLDIYQIPLSSKVDTGEIIKKGEKQKVHTIEFTTVTAPLVSSTEPTGNSVLTDTVIKVVFDNDMDKNSVEEAFSINPEIEGDISWEDDKTFIFTPSNPLSKETHYDITFKQGMKNQTGGISEQDIIFAFDTVGAVKVIGWYPGYGATNVKTSTSINVTFDQEVDHSSAQSNFSTSPALEGTFSWSGNTMIFSPSSSLDYSTKYTITVTSGITTVHGYDSRQNFTSVFTTESNIFTLNVPLYRQTHAFTCNITASAMALAYKGAPSSEMGVYNGIAKDNTPCTKNGNTIVTWGNPHAGYIGNIDGAGDCGGYGVYWGPVASYASSRGVSTQVRSGWNVAGLAQEVERGNPVVIWGQNGWAAPTNKSWITPDGQYIYAINGMHSEVVIGFIGPSSSPSHIITNDPWRGRRTLTIAQFNSTWHYFNYTGLIFY